MKEQLSKKTLKGTVLIAVSALFFGTYGIWSKIMSGTFGEFNQAWIRAFMFLLILIPLGFLTRSFRNIAKADIKWFVLISLMGGLNQAPYFWGFKHLPVGTATLLFYLLLTIGAYIIGALFFTEKMTKVKYASLILSVIGLSVIYRFSLTPDQVLPALSTMLAGFMGAIFVVFSKKISSNYTELQILTFALVGMFFCNGLFSFLFHETTPVVALSGPWMAQVAYGFSHLIANLMVFAGFKYLEPSIGGIIGLLEVIFAAVFGVIFFHEIITSELVIGSLLIIIAVGLSDIYSLIKK